MKVIAGNQAGVIQPLSGDVDDIDIAQAIVFAVVLSIVVIEVYTRTDAAGIPKFAKRSEGIVRN